MIFFDLDGTLLDHSEAERRGALAFQCEHSDVFKESPSEFVLFWRSVSEKHMDRFLAGEIGEQDQRRARMRELFSRNCSSLSDRDADELFEQYLARYQQSWFLFADVMPFLAGAKNRRMGIITNGGPTQQRKKLVDTRISDFFDVVVISGETGVSKPDARIFETACQQASAQPEVCVYVGDRLETDAVAASDAGLLGIWLDRNGEASGGIRVPVIQNLAQLPELLKSHNKPMVEPA